jgi:hypothetical protein
MRKINNLEELIMERERLRLRKDFLEGEITRSYNEIKSSLAPLNALRKGATHLLGSKHSDVLSNSVGGAIEFVLRNFILKRAGIISRLLLPYLAKNATANLVTDHKLEIINILSGFLSSFTKRKKKEQNKVVNDRNTSSEEIY